MNKKYSWTIVFLSLFLMTFFTVSDLFGSGVNSALAGMVKENKGKKFVVLGAEHNKGFLKKIDSLMKAETLCSVDQQQLDELSSVYQTSTEEVMINGEAIQLVKIGGDKVKKKDITDYLGESCKTVKSHKWYYMLFSSNLS